MIPHPAFMATGVEAAIANHLWQSSIFAVAAWLMALQLRGIERMCAMGFGWQRRSSSYPIFASH